MAGLVTVNTDSIVEQVRTLLRDFPQVAGAYLFGSALGLCRPDSDIDLGLILERGIEPGNTEGEKIEAAVAVAFRPLEGHPFDVMVLNPARPLFAFRVIRDGRLIYVRDPERVSDVIEYVSRRYADLYPRYLAALEEVMEEVRSHGPGS